MDGQIVYDIAQQDSGSFLDEWPIYLIALLALVYTIFMRRRLRRAGMRKWSAWYTWSMGTTSILLIVGTFISYQYFRSDCQKYEDWLHTINYQTVEGTFTPLPHEEQLLGEPDTKLFNVGDKTFEYGLYSDTNSDITSEMLAPLSKSNAPVRVYYENKLILGIEQI